jgi:hypothetical protein
MKKLAIFASLAIALSFSATSASATTSTTSTKAPAQGDWYTELLVQDNIPVNLEGANTKYYFMHNNGKKVDMTKLEKLIKSGLNVTPQEGQTKLSTLVGVGVYKMNGTTYTDFVFEETELASGEVLKKGKERAQMTKDMANKQQPLVTEYAAEAIIVEGGSPNYVDNYAWTFQDSYNNKINMGQFNSSVQYYRQGTASINGKTNSVWDIKYFNESKPLNSYQTRKIVTRSSVQAFSAQDILSYGPETTPTSSSASVNLTGFLPSFSWTFNTASSKITNSSDMTANYGRWTFDVSLGTSTATNTFVTQPGARFTNSTGKFGVEHSHTAEYYKNLSANDIGYTGVLQRFWTDL